MKLKYFTYLILIAVFFSKISFCQNFDLKEKENKIKFGNNLGELGKNVKLKSRIPNGYVPDVIIFDLDNSIYICDKFTKNIIKYDSELNFLFEIEINEELQNSKVFLDKGFSHSVKLSFECHLSLDQYENLYVLITQNEAFYSLLKYNKNGEIVENFKLSGQYPKQRAIGILISKKDRIFIKTFPYSPVDKSYDDDGLIFAYDLDGKFLGRTNYSIEDSQGSIYLLNTTMDKKNVLWIDQFEPSNYEIINQTSSLELKASLQTSLPNNLSLPFIGIDDKNKLYYAGSGMEAPFLIRIFDFSKKTISEISLNRKEIEKALIDQFNTVLFHDPFIVSPDGSLYLYGIKSKDGIINYSCKYKSDDLELNIIKLTLKE
jgi:hypothetical protein